uniref:Uncharacterized protein n=1 Tax=Emiliania huxleyi TaxID=2903 RepID=A0A7S3STL9_EMIHU
MAPLQQPPRPPPHPPQPPPPPQPQPQPPQQPPQQQAHQQQQQQQPQPQRFADESVVMIGIAIREMRSTRAASPVLFRGRAPLNPYEERVAHEEAGIALGIPAPAFLLHGARGMRAPRNEYERTLAQHQAGVAQAAIVHEEAVYVTLRSSLRLPCGRKPRNPHEDRLALKHAGVVEAQRVAGPAIIWGLAEHSPITTIRPLRGAT